MSAPERMCCGLPLDIFGKCRNNPRHEVPPLGPDEGRAPRHPCDCDFCPDETHGGRYDLPDDAPWPEVQCCKGCPDCMGIGSREQIKGMFADIAKVIAMCEEFETSGRLGAVAGYRHSTAIRDVLAEYWTKVNAR